MRLGVIAVSVGSSDCGKKASQDIDATKRTLGHRFETRRVGVGQSGLVAFLANKRPRAKNTHGKKMKSDVIRTM